jgi:hypothetical protein
MIKFDECNLHDVVVLLDNEGVVLTGIVIEKNSDMGGNFIRVRVGYNNPRTIYMENRAVRPPFDVIRVMGNLWNDRFATVFIKA